MKRTTKRDLCSSRGRLHCPSSGRGAAWLARRSGGPKVASSNLAVPIVRRGPPAPAVAPADVPPDDDRLSLARRPTVSTAAGDRPDAMAAPVAGDRDERLTIEVWPEL